MEKEFEQRQKIERQIVRLKNKLSSTASPIGDWKGIKYREYIDAGYPAPYNDEEMRSYYAQRLAARQEINDLEKQLAALDS